MVVRVIPSCNQTAQTAAKALLLNFFIHYGFPARIHSDKGANCESKLIRFLCSLTGLRKTWTAPYNPMGNGMVERLDKTLLNMLGTHRGESKVGLEVSTMIHASTAASHNSTGFFPFFLMFGRHPRLAVNTFFGLPQDTKTVKCHQDSVDKLKQQLAMAYKTASKEAKKECGETERIL